MGLRPHVRDPSRGVPLLRHPDRPRARHAPAAPDALGSRRALHVLHLPLRRDAQDDHPHVHQGDPRPLDGPPRARARLDGAQHLLLNNRALMCISTPARSSTTRASTTSHRTPLLFVAVVSSWMPHALAKEVKIANADEWLKGAGIPGMGAKRRTGGKKSGK